MRLAHALGGKADIAKPGLQQVTHEHEKSEGKSSFKKEPVS
jgi:hypothetical protein